MNFRNYIRIVPRKRKYFYNSRASLIAQLVKNPPAIQETQFNSWVGKIP